MGLRGELDAPFKTTGSPRMSRLKVMYLITGLNIGGAEKSLLQTLRCIDRDRFEPIVVSMVGGPLGRAIATMDIPVVNLKMRGKWDVSVIGRMVRLLKIHRPEILHAHLYDADQLARLASLFCRVPCLFSTLHAFEPFRRRWYWRWLDRLTSSRVQAFIAVSERVKQQFVQEGIDAERILVIPNGVGRRATDRNLCRKEKRQALGLPDQAKLIGVVGRMELPVKGQDVFLKALSKMKTPEPVYTVLIGDGPQRRQLEAWASGFGLSDRVRFVGWQHSVEDWLSALDVLCLPSRSEGSPMVLLEAMAQHCPVVATDVGGVKDLITDGVEGLVVPAESARSLAETLDTALADPSECTRRAEAAYLRYKKLFASEVVVESLERLYFAHMGNADQVVSLFSEKSAPAMLESQA